MSVGPKWSWGQTGCEPIYLHKMNLVPFLQGSLIVFLFFFAFKNMSYDLLIQSILESTLPDINLMVITHKGLSIKDVGKFRWVGNGSRNTDI